MRAHSCYNKDMENCLIKTERLIIGKFRTDMAQSVSSVSKDDDTRRFMPDEVFETEEDARETLEFLIECYDGTGGPFVYPVFLLDGTHVGHVEAVNLGNGKWEIGYHIGKAYTGRGYATEAVRAFLPYALDTLRINEIYGICVSENFASKRVLEKCGFIAEFEGDGLYQGKMRPIYRAVFNK